MFTKYVLYSTICLSTSFLVYLIFLILYTTQQLNETKNNYIEGESYVKVAFWSNDYEKSCAYLNFAAVSIASVMSHPYKITVLENYLGRDNIGKTFFKACDVENPRYVGTGFYEGRGIEGLLRRIYRGDNNPSLLRGYIKEVIPKHLDYIPQGGVINSELFDFELYNNIYDLLHLLDRNTDLIYINTNQKNHLSSQAILQEADIIVVNLYQNSDYLEEFFKNYYSLIPKALFIVGDYSPKSIMSCKRISRLYDIPLEDISPIPYNDYFHVACNNSSAKEFLNSNYFCSRENPNFLFVYGVRKAVHMIARRINKPTLLVAEDAEYCGI